MRKILLLIVSIIAFSATMGQGLPGGLPIVKTSGWYKIGYVQTDSGFIAALRDTSWQPKFAGTLVYWQHAGVDTSLWIHSGLKWVKTGGSSSTVGTVTSVSGLSPLFSVSNPTTTPTFILSNTTTYTVFGRATGTGIPSYIHLDTNYITSFSTYIRPLLSAGAGISYNSTTGAITNTNPSADSSFFRNPLTGDSLLIELTPNYFLFKSLVADYGIINTPTDTTIVQKVDTATLFPAIRATINTGGSQTPWLSNINGANYGLDSVKWLRVGVSGGIITENLAFYSAEPQNASYYGSTDITVTGNQALDVEGNLTMAELNITNAGSNLFRNVNTPDLLVTPGETLYFSMDVKQGTLTGGTYSVFDATNAVNIIAPTNFSIPAGLSTRFTSASFVVPIGCTEIYIYPARDVASTGTYFVGRLQVHHLGNAYIQTTNAQAPPSGGGGYLTAIATDSVTADVYMPNLPIEPGVYSLRVGSDGKLSKVDTASLTGQRFGVLGEDDVATQNRNVEFNAAYNLHLNDVKNFELSTGDYIYMQSNAHIGGDHTRVDQDSARWVSTVASGMVSTSYINQLVDLIEIESNAGPIHIQGTETVLQEDGGDVAIRKTGATEALDVNGNFRLSGAFMPNNAAGTTGQILTSAGAGAPPTWGTGFSLAIGSTITSATAGSVLFAGTGGTLMQKNSDFFYDSTNKRLGIGTNIPTKGLTVYSGDIAIATPASGMATFNFGTLATPGYYTIQYNDNTGNTTLGSSGYDQIFMNTNSSLEIMRLKSTGKVGIGTNAPGYILDVLSSDAGINAANIYNSSATGNGLYVSVNNSNSIVHAFQVGGGSGGGSSLFDVRADGKISVGGITPTSTFHDGGSFALAYVGKTTTYSVTATDQTIDCTGGGTFTVTLPTAVGCTGRMYTIKNSGAGIITVATTSSQNIDAATTYTLPALYKYVSVMSNNVSWIVIANN